MAVGACLSIITLNVNRIMLQWKDIEWLNGCKFKTCIYAAYKRLTLDLKTHTDWKRRDKKGISSNWKWKERLNSNTYFRQIGFKTQIVKEKKTSSW